MDYHQAIYNDECKMLCAITTQAEIISKCLGSCARRDLLASTGEAPYLPRFVETLHNRDSITHVLHSGFTDAGTNTDTDTNSDFGEDDDSSRWPDQQQSCAHHAFLVCKVHVKERGSQQKTKAKVLKPPQGSGLNPSFESATDQLCIPTEQPQMSSFSFDVHAASGGWQGDTDSAFPTQMSSGNSSLHSWNRQGANLDGGFSHSHPYGASSLEQNMQGTNFGGSFSHSHPYSASSLEQNMQGANLNGDFSYSHPYGASSLEHRTSFDDHGDAHPYSSNNHTSYDTASLEVPSQGISYPPQGSQSFQDTTAGTSTSEVMLIQLGEIPHTEVMHVNSRPGKGGKEVKHPSSNATYTTLGSIPNNAPSEVLTSQTLMSKSLMAKPSPIKLSDDIIDQTVKTAMRLVTPTFEDFICGKHCKAVANALSSTHGKFVDFAHEGIFNAYRLFPPWHSVTPPTIYHQHMIEKITTDADGLVFMHIYTFDQNGKVKIKVKFQNAFVMSNAIRFTWTNMHQEFLGDMEEEQIECLKVIWALIGAATFCSLDEQSEVRVKVDRFGGMVCNRKFLTILATIRSLTGDKLTEFHDFLQYVLVVGPTQSPS
ncbi:hypothetical protein BD769DRAFT_1393330 [Suillus cothurnatus]|nr:hypothetical protein BD769DRAFT_1393330 [Suillus cothurnatus]